MYHLVFQNFLSCSYMIIDGSTYTLTTFPNNLSFIFIQKKVGFQKNLKVFNKNSEEINLLDITFVN
jgi:hypothetical protein